MATSHIVKAFDKDLNEIETLLLEMGGMVEGQIIDAVDALTNRDVELGMKVKKADKQVDKLELQVDELIVRLIARRQPMAEDLRAAVSAMKVSTSLERMGDYAKNIGKRTSVIVAEAPIPAAMPLLKQMSSMLQEMIASVLEAYINRDVELADDIRQRDEEVDELHNSVFRALLTYMMEDPRSITAAMHLLFVAKNLERIGDYTTDIAEQLHYFVTGNLPEEKRPKGDKTSYIGYEEDDTDQKG